MHGTFSMSEKLGVDKHTEDHQYIQLQDEVLPVNSEQTTANKYKYEIQERHDKTKAIVMA